MPPTEKKGKEREREREREKKSHLLSLMGVHGPGVNTRCQFQVHHRVEIDSTRLDDDDDDGDDDEELEKDTRGRVLSCRALLCHVVLTNRRV